MEQEKRSFTELEISEMEERGETIAVAINDQNQPPAPADRSLHPQQGGVAENADAAEVVSDEGAPETNHSKRAGGIMSAEEWLNVDFTVDERNVILGTPKNPLVRPGTKNFVEASEKSFKTTFLMRLALGISTGTSVFSSLPVNDSRPVLYLHGELSPPEIKERLQDATRDLPRPLENFFQGRDLNASLVTEEGQLALRRLVAEFKPQVLVIDPWQSFIAGSEENSFKEMSGATQFMDRLIAERGVTIFIAIHQGKNQKKGARGHSVLAGWRDTRFLLNRDGSGLTVTVEPRWAAPPKPLRLVFKAGTLWEGNAPKWTDQEQRILDNLRDYGGKLPRRELEFLLDLKESTFRTALMRARDKGLVESDKEMVWLPVVTDAVTQPPL